MGENVRFLRYCPHFEAQTAKSGSHLNPQKAEIPPDDRIRRDR